MVNLLFNTYLLITTSILLVSDGYSIKRLRSENRLELRIIKRDVGTLKRHDKVPFAHPLLRGVTNEARRDTKLTMKLSEVVKACKGKKGDARKTCVASLVRQTYPNYFNKEKMDKTTTNKVDITSTKPSVTKPACKTVTVAEGSKTSNIAKRSALLITSGVEKTISPVTQEVIVENTALIKDENQLICQAEEFGYEIEIASSVVVLTSQVLCALCQDQGDQECIERHCVHV
ncbi:hypothetical protein ACF0H5_020033 [Mactra antiquata]